MLGCVLRFLLLETPSRMIFKHSLHQASTPLLRHQRTVEQRLIQFETAFRHIYLDCISPARANSTVLLGSEISSYLKLHLGMPIISVAFFKGGSKYYIAIYLSKSYTIWVTQMSTLDERETGRIGNLSKNNEKQWNGYCETDGILYPYAILKACYMPLGPLARSETCL
jgi:hypothetical protein